MKYIDYIVNGIEIWYYGIQSDVFIKLKRMWGPVFIYIP